MTESGQDDRVPDDRAASALSDAVKSAILDRLLDGKDRFPTLGPFNG